MNNRSSGIGLKQVPLEATVFHAGVDGVGDVADCQLYFFCRHALLHTALQCHWLTLLLYPLIHIIMYLKITLIALVISLGPFIMGFSLVALSVLQQPIATANHLSPSDSSFYLSLLTSTLPLFALLSSFFLNFLSNRLGQNFLMIAMDVMGLFGCLTMWSDLSLVNLGIGRAVLGVYCGIISGVTPSYLVSIAPQEVKGRVGSFNQLMITIGIAAAYYLGQYVPSALSANNYLMIPAIALILRIIMLRLFPFDRLERHAQNNEKEALQAYMEMVYGYTDISQLLQEFSQAAVKDEDEDLLSRIKKELEEPKQITPPQSAPTNGLITVLALANQLSGINAILFYAKQLFMKLSNNSEIQANAGILHLGLFQVGVTLCSGILIDRLGRKFLMLLGSLIVSGSLLGGYLASQMEAEGYIMGIIFLHIFGFSLSLGPVSMVYAAQIEDNLQGMVALLWTLTLIVAGVSGIMMDKLGIGKVLGVYGVISFWCLLYLYRNMIETKGLTRSEIHTRLIAKLSQS